MSKLKERLAAHRREIEESIATLRVAIFRHLGKYAGPGHKLADVTYEIVDDSGGTGVVFYWRPTPEDEDSVRYMTRYFRDLRSDLKAMGRETLASHYADLIQQNVNE